MKTPTVKPSQLQQRTAHAAKSKFVPATGLGWLLPWYDWLIARFIREAKFRSHLLSQCQLLASARGPLSILDAGCGSGTWLEQALQTDAHHAYHGVDIDPRILAQARGKLAAHQNWSLHQASLTHIDLAPHQFDAIVCSLVFHHLTTPEKQAALTQFSRLLKPGGRLLLADLAQPAHPIAHLQFLPVRFIDGWSRTAANVRGELPPLISAAGFSQVRETLQLDTWLGTLRCYSAIHYDASARPDRTH